MKSLVPMAQVRDVPTSARFYALLGFQEGGRHTPEGAAEPVWAWLHCGGAQLMVSRGDAPDPKVQGVLFYLYCSDVPAFRAELAAKGLSPGPIERPFWAPGGEFRLEDPDGYVLMVTHT
jgi:hypothetical protein